MKKIPISYEINDNGCHVCTSHKLSHGYPNIRLNKRRWRVSRYIYTLKYGEIPEGLIVRHKCDNRACINIDHLELGTHQDNREDAVLRGRSFKGEDHP